MKIVQLIIILIGASIILGCSSNSYIKTYPSGAEIYVDGAYTGDSPCLVSTRSLTSITIEAKKEGYKTVTRIINARQANEKTLCAIPAGLCCGPIGMGATGASTLELPPEIEITLEREGKK